MRSNKGYTLAELLVSIAIFSIVMLSIVTVMRNVSISYRNESAEVQLQENSQMVLSYVEELLVDCTEIQGSGTDSSPYVVKDSNGINHRLKVVGDQLLYKYDAASYEVLASNIDSFMISGIDPNPADSNDLDGNDNKCIIHVSMLNNVDGKEAGGKDYTYEASKDIVFRNDVEELDIHDGGFLTGGGGGGGYTPPTPDTVSVEIGRYQVVNLVAEYNFDETKPINLTQGTTAGYAFVNAGTNAQTNGLTTPITYLTTGSSSYITTNATCNKDTDSPFSCTVTGTTLDGQAITLSITTPPVSLEKGTGIVYAPVGALNNGTNKNFYSYIKVKGLCIRDAKKYYNGINFRGELDFTSIPGNNTKRTGNIFDCTSDYVNSGNFGDFTASNVPSAGGMSCKTGLGYDPFSSDTLCVMFSSKLYENNDYTKQNTFNGHNYEVKIRIEYPHSTSTTWCTPVSYKVYTSGDNLGGSGN